MPAIEAIRFKDKVLGYLIRHTGSPKKTQFVTDSKDKLQVGFVVYPRGGEVTPHIHLPVKRRTVGTAELVYVKKGGAESKSTVKPATW